MGVLTPPPPVGG